MGSSQEPVDVRRWPELGKLLLGDDPLIDRLTSYLATCRRMLTGLSLPALLEVAFPHCDEIEYLCSQSVPSLHVGFLTPPGAIQEALPKAAAATGFGLNHRSFPSTIMSRELGELLGTRRVPTTIFKASAKPDNGVWVSLEAFIPDTDPAILTGWIDRGVGTHLGISMGSLESVFRALEISQSAGFTLPPFMDNKVATNPAEELTAFYADGDTLIGRLRLEFFHDPHEVTAVRASATR